MVLHILLNQFRLLAVMLVTDMSFNWHLSHRLGAVNSILFGERLDLYTYLDGDAVFGFQKVCYVKILPSYTAGGCRDWIFQEHSETFWIVLEYSGKFWNFLKYSKNISLRKFKSFLKMLVISGTF